jgi:glycosyltransferase involved in cell wall biosynthesis
MASRLLFVVSEDKYFVSHRIHLARHAMRNGYQVGFVGNVTCHRAEIEAAGIEVYDWCFERGSINPFTQFKNIFSLAKRMRAFSPDVIHAVSAKPILYSSIACWRLPVKKKVFALAGLGFAFSSSSLRARLLKRIISTALRMAFYGKNKTLIMQNKDDVHEVVSLKIIPLDKITLIRGAGVNVEEFSPPIEQNKEVVVVLPARLLWDKGVAEFVEAAKRIKISGLSARFALVGEPDSQNPESIPLSIIKEWVREGYVEWWGYQENMPEVYRSSEVVCLPSYREGLPKSLLEAASCARPLVAFDVPGCREVVIDGETGFLVPFGDIECLVTRLTELISSRAKRTQFGDAGRRLVMSQFSEEIISAETAVVWSEMSE